MLRQQLPLRVDWNGGSPITSYTVTSSPGGKTATGASSPITVTGLTNGTAYTFTVTATNALGTGPASSPSNSVTPVGPGHSTGSPDRGNGNGGERPGDGHLHGSCFGRRKPHHLLHGDFKSWRQDGNRDIKPDNGDRTDQRDRLYLHGNGNQRGSGQDRPQVPPTV